MMGIIIIPGLNDLFKVVDPYEQNLKSLVESTISNISDNLYYYNGNLQKIEVDKISICAFCCIPFIAQTLVGQFSSWIYFSFILGLLAFDNRKDFIAGFLMSLSLVKPHLFILVYLAFGYEVLKEKRLNTIFGGLFGVLIFSLISETRFSGIHNLWLYREQWPVEYLGATLPSLVSKMFFGLSKIKILQIISLIVGILSIIIFRVCMKRYIFKDFLIFAFISNSILSPYGFVFDQICLIFVITYVVGSYIEDTKRQNNIYIKVILFYVFHIVLFHIGSKMNYDWYLLPFFVAWLFWNEKLRKNSLKIA